MIGYFIGSGRVEFKDCVGFRVGRSGGFIYYLGDGDIPYLGINSGACGRLYGPWGYWSE
jgi:hypothetical protein